MALAIHTNEAEAVAEASLVAHRAHRLEAVVDSSLPVPVIRCPDLKTAELALGPRHDVRSITAEIETLVLEGWEVTVLVPSRQLGVAHAVLRGTPVILQPWWTEAGLVHFGRPEIP